MRAFLKSEWSITDRTSDSIEKYFRDVNRQKRVSPEEEAELACIIRKGGKEAETARKQLIQANLRFVISIAKQCRKSSTLDLSDLIDEGNIGLIKAVDRFDETRGFKFISYAVWWIRQSILEAQSHYGSCVRIPENKQSLLRRYHQMQQDMLQKEQRKISIDEFCEVSGVSRDSIESLLGTSDMPVSLDDKIKEDSDSTIGDFMSSEDSTDAVLTQESLHIDLEDVIERVLSPREAFVVRSLYGIGEKQMPMEEVADALGLSFERTRQICLSALKKIKRSSYASRLSCYLAA